MTPLFTTNDPSLSDDEIAALTAVIVEAQTRMSSNGPHTHATLPHVQPFGTAPAVGNVTYY